MGNRNPCSQYKRNVCFGDILFLWLTLNVDGFWHPLSPNYPKKSHNACSLVIFVSSHNYCNEIAQLLCNSSIVTFD